MVMLFINTHCPKMVMLSQDGDVVYKYSLYNLNTHCPESQDGETVYNLNTHCPESCPESQDGDVVNSVQPKYSLPLPNESQDGDVVYKYSLPRESRW